MARQDSTDNPESRKSLCADYGVPTTGNPENEYMKRYPFTLYLIGGPDGVYVGVTSWLVRYRWLNQKGEALRKGGISPHPLHVAIRTHGKRAFCVRVIAASPTKKDALAMEAAIEQQLRREGVNLYNVWPCGLGSVGSPYQQRATAP